MLPSATFPVYLLTKITAIQHYEERMLFTALLLRQPARHLVYLSSLPIDESIVDYYLRVLPDPADARRRLAMVAVGQPGPEPLTHKLLGRREVVERVRGLVHGVGDAYVLPFNVTPAELRLADALDLPVFGPHPDLAVLGSKTGSRQVARRAGVAVPAGAEDLRSLEEVEAAIEAVRAERPTAVAVVIKLNNGFSGQGNAIVELDGPVSPLVSSKTTFCADDESWEAFADRIGREGAIVEELVRGDGMSSPSVQMRIAPSGAPEVLSTHDQILGGVRNQVYLWCRFPTDRSYRLALQDTAM